MKTRINYRPEISEVFKAVTDKKLDRRYYLIMQTEGTNNITYSLCKKSVNFSDEDIARMVMDKYENGYSFKDLDEEDVVQLLRDLRDSYEEFIKEVFED